MSERIVVVAGSTGALGRAVVSAFEGDIVIGLARSTGVDLTDAAAARRAIDTAAEKHGRIDVLVHTAGAFAPGDAWESMMSINFSTALNALEAVLPHMRSRKAGRIVMVGSRAGEEFAPGSRAYSVSKAALHALVRSTAVEVKRDGITVNAVLPGVIDTDANRQWGKAEQVGSWVPPERIAAAIRWLASDEAVDVNGALLPVYGRS